MTRIETAPPEEAAPRAVHRAGLALVVTVWVSMLLFGVYVLLFYAGAIPDRDLASWNDVLPRIYEPRSTAANVAIGAHFAAGAVILLLGFVQLIAPLRERWPVVHRTLGRVYVVASLVAGVGGTTYIVVRGTVGGPVMSLGFGLYGVLMTVCAVQTFRYARAREIETHRAWALRLFALAVGSWLYRMDYGFWTLLAGDAGHTELFRGWFDHFMAFAFYLPNLVVVEVYLRGRGRPENAATRRVTVGVLVAATLFLVLGTYFFTTELWAPGIAQRLG